jgi:hypothetical protein
LPILISEESKNKFYHHNYIKVSTGNAISEHMMAENAFDKFVVEAAKLSLK